MPAGRHLMRVVENPHHIEAAQWLVFDEMPHLGAALTFWWSYTREAGCILGERNLIAIEGMSPPPRTQPAFALPIVAADKARAYSLGYMSPCTTVGMEFKRRHHLSGD